MIENANTSTHAPEGGSGNEPEIVEPGGTRRPMNPTEAWIFRETAAKTKPAAQPAAEQHDGHAPEGDEPQSQQQDSTTAEGHELEVPIEVPREFFEETQANVEQVSQIAAEIGMVREEAQGLVDYAVALAVSEPSGVNLADED